MIVMDDVNGPPHDRGPRGDLDPEPYDDDQIPDQTSDLPEQPPEGDGWDDDNPGPGTPAGRLWQAFTAWIDEYAWTIIVLGISLILLDVLLVLTMLLYQISR